MRGAGRRVAFGFDFDLDRALVFVLLAMRDSPAENAHPGSGRALF
jgi:hypothetical protein